MIKLSIENDNGELIRDGDIFDVHQTINGQSKFVLKFDETGLSVRYLHDINYKYEYDVSELLNIEELEVIGKFNK